MLYFRKNEREDSIMLHGFKHIKKRTISFMLALLVLCTVAYPSSSEAASKKVSIYVVSKVISNEGNIEYTYNTNGLIKTCSRQNTKYYYKGKVLKKEVSSYTQNTGDQKSVTKYDKKGNVISIQEINADGTIASSSKYTYKYNSKGNKVSEKRKQSGTVTTIKYKYDKKGRLSKSIGNPYTDSYTYDKNNNIIKLLITATGHKASDFSRVYNYKYDKYGYVTAIDIKESIDKASQTTSKNYKYSRDKNGLITKCTIKVSGAEASGKSSITKKYKYKKITVPKSYEKTILKQQYEKFFKVIY